MWYCFCNLNVYVDCYKIECVMLIFLFVFADAIYITYEDWNSHSTSLSQPTIRCNLHYIRGLKCQSSLIPDRLRSGCNLHYIRGLKLTVWNHHPHTALMQSTLHTRIEICMFFSIFSFDLSMQSTLHTRIKILTVQKQWLIL